MTAQAPTPSNVADVEEALRDVVDPELGINVVDLGLVYGITVDPQNHAVIDMTLTSAACPLTDVIEDQVDLDRWVAGFAARHDGVTRADVPGSFVLTGGDGATATGEPFDHPRIGLVLVRRGGHAVGRDEGGELLAHTCGTAYVQGRTKKGPIVTWVRGGSSYHNYGLAADFAAEGEPLPRIGGHWIACDGAGEPRVVLRSVELRVGRFDSVDAAFAFDEGEDDRTLESWKDNHRRYWQRTCAARGVEWREDDEIVARWTRP